jgi:hypothetical protein
MRKKTSKTRAKAERDAIAGTVYSNDAWSRHIILDGSGPTVSPVYSKMLEEMPTMIHTTNMLMNVACRWIDFERVIVNSNKGRARCDGQTLSTSHATRVAWFA